MLSRLETRVASRYVQPLREGGSLPAVVETTEGELFVVKFRGAGLGARVLVAELVVGLLARAVGLDAPELAIVELSVRFGRTEPDPEIQELLRRSHGLNVGLRYLDGAFNYDAGAAGDAIPPELAARMIWLDALTTNPDRTARNPNLLVWHGALWCIDHGAALYRHHGGSDPVEHARAPFPLIAHHVLLGEAGDLHAADERLADRVGEEELQAILDLVPAEWLGPAGGQAYVASLTERLKAPRAWMEAAQHVR